MRHSEIGVAPERPRRASHRFSGRGLVAVLLVGVGGALLGGCSKPKAQKLPPKTETLAELRVVRAGVHVTEDGGAERDPFPRERLTEAEVVRIDDGGLAWIRRDGGSTVLVKGPARVVAHRDTLDITEGRVFAESPQGIVTSVTTPDGPLLLSDVRASLEVHDGTSDVYVLAGEVRTPNGDVASSGELLHLGSEGGKRTASVTPKASWDDWTGGLATTDRSASPAPFGLGTVGARNPGSLGAPRAALTIQRLDVRVKVDGDFVTTEVDETFFNPVSDTVEGIYRFRAPEGANLERFGVDRLDGIAWGFVKEKQAAAAQYSSNVYRGSKEDPALLEWKAPGEYEAKLYPIPPGGTRRVVVRYTEWLGRSGKNGERRLYVYPMAADGAEGSLPHVEEFNAEIDLGKANAGEVRSGMQATRAGTVINVREHDFVPRADLAIELFDPIPTGKEGDTTVARDASVTPVYRTAHVPDYVMLPPGEAASARRAARSDEADYVLVPVSVADLPKTTGGLDVEIVVDSSAATDDASLALARAAAKSLLAHLGKADRIAVFTGDDQLRPASGTSKFKAADDDAKAEALAALAHVRRGGATDLGRVLTAAIENLDPSRNSAIIYIGDGNPTVGELSLNDLEARLAKAPRPARIFTLGVGESANMALLDGIAQGGFAAPIADEHEAALASLRVLERATRAVDLGVTVDLGPNVERVFPHDAASITEGETLLVVGRVTGKDLPTELVAKGSAGTHTFKLKAAATDDHGDLRRRWAASRLSELMADGAGQAALVDLGVRQGILTPFTSIYVPTASEMTPEQRASIEKLDAPRRRALREEDADDGDRFESPDENRRRPSKSASATSTDKSESKRDAEEERAGGTGQRAKGEEGQMGKAPASKPMDTPTTVDPAPMATAAASASPQGYDGAPEPEQPGAKHYGDARANGEPGGPNRPGPTATSAPPASPPMTTPPAYNMPTPRPNLANETAAPPPGLGTLGLTGRASGGGGRGEPDPKTANDETGNARVGAKDTAAQSGEPREKQLLKGLTGGLVSPIRYEGPAHVRIDIDDPGRIARPCGEASKLPYGERLSLWRERLQSMGGRPEGMKLVYEAALVDCELPTARERAALLTMMLDFIPSTGARVSLYRLMAEDMGAADILYRGILSRVTTPTQVRELSLALGLVTVDPSVLEKAIKDAKTPADKVTVLRALFAQFPNDLNLALLVLDALEDAKDAPGARLFADTLRARPDADTKVRTSVGELYLRLASSGTDADEKKRDDEEARRTFGEIVEFAPNDPVARRRLGDLFRAHGYFEDASRQYETLGTLTPDDPAVPLLLAACANGLGKLEEAVRWTEKGGAAGAPDASQGPYATARAFAVTYLAWGKLDARTKKDAPTLDALTTRLTRVLSTGGSKATKGQARIVLTWSHPEFHPSLWSNALGPTMPAPEGDATLGVSQVILPTRADAAIEVRIEQQDLERAARLGAKATLTVVFEENGTSEVISRQDIGFERGGSNVLKFRVESGAVKQESSK